MPFGEALMKCRLLAKWPLIQVTMRKYDSSTEALVATNNTVLEEEGLINLRCYSDKSVQEINLHNAKRHPALIIFKVEHSHQH